MTRAVHYNSALPANYLHVINRVAEYCGAITWHANPQPMVVETSDWEDVTCKNCKRRGNG